MHIVIPILYFALGSFFGLVGLNSPQSYRPFILFLITTFCLLSFRDINNVGLSTNSADTCGKFIFLYLTHMISSLCVEKYVLESHEKSQAWDWIGAYKVLYNGRYVGTKREVTDVPHRSSFISNYFKLEGTANSKIPQSQQSSFLNFFKNPRIRFIRNRLLSLLAVYAIDHYHAKLIEYPSPYYEPLSMSDFTPSKQVFFRKLWTFALNDIDATLPTIRETTIRLWLVVDFIWSAWAPYTSIHDVLAIIFVGIGIDEPEEWRPLFGNLMEAYSVRRFWGKFWHKAIYRAYTSFGSLISRRVLRLSRRSIIGRVFVNFFVFLLSGLIHALVAKQVGFTCAHWEEARFYLLNFCAIMLEMPIHAVYRKFVPRGEQTRVAERVVGYVWVFIVLFWALPKSQMPKLWCMPAEAVELEFY